MSLEEKISELNYKYQFVKNNKYWNYNQVYDLTINDKVYQISENDVLLNISHNIVKNINGSFNNKKYMSDYEIPNIDIEQMKKIVIGFYMQVNPELSNKIAFILSKTDFIKYDENIPSNQQRSVATPEGIKIYYKNDLKSFDILGIDKDSCDELLDSALVAIKGLTLNAAILDTIHVTATKYNSIPIASPPILFCLFSFVS